MLIRNPKAFMRGLLLMGSFIVVFVLFFMPIFPGQEEGAPKSNGLVFADHLFNTLSKGSANYFGDAVKESDRVGNRIQPLKGVVTHFELPANLGFTHEGKAVDAKPIIVALLKKHGLEADEAADGKVSVKGDLFPLMEAATADSFSMYNNSKAEVAARNPEAMELAGGDADLNATYIMRSWWKLTDSMIKPLQKEGFVAEASTINYVKTKAIETGYNFYGITPMKVSDNIPLVAGFLIFYVIYTMWYGFAIFELFEGIGLTMKKAAKQEG